jgi:glycosyltransferase involved in cell wall biosynthesis
MSEIKVSVVMPSKNVKKYIRECVESVINQTLPNIEIICVDAFSTDGTREIIEEYANRDSRVILLDDTQGSCGYAYNIGIEKASGKYIGFVETDDYIKNDMFEKLYNVAEEYNLDYVKGNHTRFVSIGEEKYFEEERVFRMPGYEKLYGTIIDVSKHPEVNWFDHCMWNGIYKKDFLVKKGVKLNESKGASYQDHGFQWQTMLRAQRAMYLDSSFYYYRIDNENASMKNLNGLEKDYNEFVFVKNILENTPTIMPEHWMIYYDKMFFTIRRWIEMLANKGIDVSERQLQIIDNWISDIRKGYDAGYVSPKLIGIHEYRELMMLINDAEAYKSYLIYSIKVLDQYLTTLIGELTGKSIVIFSAGKFGRILYAYAQKNNISVECFCDNKASNGMKYMGIDVISPQEAVKKYQDAFFVIANQVNFMDCMRQLIELGVKRDQIGYYEVTDRELV